MPPAGFEARACIDHEGRTELRCQRRALAGCGSTLPISWHGGVDVGTVLDLSWACAHPLSCCRIGFTKIELQDQVPTCSYSACARGSGYLICFDSPMTCLTPLGPSLFHRLLQLLLPQWSAPRRTELLAGSKLSMSHLARSLTPTLPRYSGAFVLMTPGSRCLSRDGRQSGYCLQLQQGCGRRGD